MPRDNTIIAFTPFPPDNEISPFSPEGFSSSEYIVFVNEKLFFTPRGRRLYKSLFAKVGINIDIIATDLDLFSLLGLLPLDDLDQLDHLYLVEPDDEEAWENIMLGIQDDDDSREYRGKNDD